VNKVLGPELNTGATRDRAGEKVAELEQSRARFNPFTAHTRTELRLRRGEPALRVNDLLKTVRFAVPCQRTQAAQAGASVYVCTATRHLRV
jgi:hypothetical protein